MRRFLYDTNVFVYALGRAHPLRAPCQAIVSRVADGELRGEASCDLVQEFAHQRYRQTGDRVAACRSARRVAQTCLLHALQPSDVLRGLELLERHPRLNGRDASFAAVALGRGIDAILTADHAFDDVPGLERIDPADGEAVAGLAA